MSAISGLKRDLLPAGVTFLLTLFACGTVFGQEAKKHDMAPETQALTGTGKQEVAPKAQECLNKLNVATTAEFSPHACASSILRGQTPLLVEIGDSEGKAEFALRKRTCLTRGVTLEREDIVCAPLATGSPQFSRAQKRAIECLQKVEEQHGSVSPAKAGTPPVSSDPTRCVFMNTEDYRHRRRAPALIMGEWTNEQRAIVETFSEACRHRIPFRRMDRRNLRCFAIVQSPDPGIRLIK